MTKKTILISAGHSTVPPRDPGAVGNNYTEAVEAVKIRDSVAANIREMNLGIEVLEDGFDGINDPLKKALELAGRADKKVEFHFNASTNPKASGIEVLAKPANRKLAQALAAGIQAALNLPLRGGDGGYKSDKSGQHHRLAFCEKGGLIVEVCFISNPSDMRAYKENFDAMCRNIADFLVSEIGLS